MGFFDTFFGKTGNNDVTNRKSDLSEAQGLSDVPDLNIEFASDLTAEGNNAVLNDSYSDNGVCLQDAPDAIRLVYNGILAKSGAKEIYSVIGYGNNLSWEETEQYPMYKNGDQTFELLFPIKRDGNINIAFTDGHDNWDNNSEMNYSYYNNSYRGGH